MSKCLILVVGNCDSRLQSPIRDLDGLSGVPILASNFPVVVETTSPALTCGMNGSSGSPEVCAFLGQLSVGLTLATTFGSGVEGSILSSHLG